MVATADPAAVAARRFVPRDLDLTDPGAVEPLYRSLIDRPVASAGELEAWLGDFSELVAALDEYGCRCYVEKSCHTDDKQIERAYLHYVELVSPRVKPLYFEAQKKFLASPFLPGLTGPRYAMLIRNWQTEAELYRDENVAIETEVEKVVSEYDKICGAQSVEVDGKEYTLEQASRFVEEPDRALRQRAWEAVGGRRLRDRETCDEIFDRLLGLRQRIARNAGLSDYRAYRWKSFRRVDYTPEDCLRFADAIAELCVPVVMELHARRARDLGMAALRPWDLAVDPLNRPALRPFPADDAGRLVDGTQAILARLSPALAEEFESLRTNGTLDLGSRKGKQPGGYLCPLEESKRAFIFMNAAGQHWDIETLLHEGGHALHYLSSSSNEPLVFLRWPTNEFVEVPSMAMELLGAEHLDVFYPDPADAARARRVQLEVVITMLPRIAMVDSFQHWLYTHPGHSRAERTGAWVALANRFTPGVDWSGYEAIREASWQTRTHVFQSPFYYVEYGMAQLGALQIWLKSKEDPRRALANYRASLKLGGSRSIPELYAAAGIRFDFSAKTIGPLIEAVREELASLPR